MGDMVQNQCAWPKSYFIKSRLAKKNLREQLKNVHHYFTHLALAPFKIIDLLLDWNDKLVSKYSGYPFF